MSNGNRPKQVTSTQNVFFDQDFKTFRLYAGKSMYAFCITPELALEHLYWGEALPPGYDLRYLSQSSRNAHFNTVEASPTDQFGGRIVLEAETLEEVMRAYKESVAKSTSLDKGSAFQKRRMENYSWRILNKASQTETRTRSRASSLTPPASSLPSRANSSNSLPRPPLPEGDEGNGNGNGNGNGSESGSGKGAWAGGGSGNEEVPNTFADSQPFTVPMGEGRGGSKPLLPSGSHTSSPKPRSRKGTFDGMGGYGSGGGGTGGGSGGEGDMMGRRRRSQSNPHGLVPRVRKPSIDGLGSDDEEDKYTARVQQLQAFARLMGGPAETTGHGHGRKEVWSGGKKKHVHRHQQKQSFERTGVGKGLLNVEYSDYGTGDFRSPSFMVVDNCNGSNISPLRYRRHAIYRGKLPMPDSMPGIRCASEREASTLVVTLADVGTGLEVDLVYVAMHEYDTILRRSAFRNSDTRPARSGEGLGNSKVVQKACSMSIDFEATANPFHLVKLSGSWGRERYVKETPLSHGMQSFGSNRGVSGHVFNPFMAISIGAPSETTGEVRAFSFIYSGNYLMEAEVSEMGRLRCNVGINPMGLQWHLTPGQVFSTPEVVMVRSSEGLGGMSRSLHRLFLDRLLPRNWSDALPPILLNSWEAKYFHVNHSNIVEMATQASKIGINLIVLDDGWFGKRENDTCSLGDWVADLAKFPLGIKGLAEDVNAAGCKFGIWFEPEMVSEDSMLYTSHPDWYLHVPGRPRQLGRNQMVLDLSRAVVVDYLFHSLAAILGTANVEYVKWDMNRPLTEVYSAAPDMGDAWQAEVSHRYVLGVYQLMDRVTTAFPHILLENCASGGGRFDPGMLYYSPQIWCSDNTDALIRMKIQYGTSLAYPARSIGAHVSTVPNHITGSTTRLRTRGFVAMCGTFGYELDISTASAKDLMAWEAQINLYRALSPTIRWGDLYRLWDPFKVNLASWMYVSRDKSQAVVFAFSMNSDHWSNLVPRLLLQGLLPDAEYEITEPMPNNITQASGNLMIIETEVPVYQLGVTSAVLTGNMLMQAGLPVKFYTLDDSVMFLLNRVETGNMGMGMGGGGSMGGGGGGRGMGGMGGGMGGGGGGMGGGMGGSSGALSSLRLNLQGHSSSPTINALGNLGSGTSSASTSSKLRVLPRVNSTVELMLEGRVPGPVKRCASDV